MNPENFKLGKMAIHKPTGKIGTLSKRFFDHVELQFGTMVELFNWEEVVLLDDCDVTKRDCSLTISWCNCDTKDCCLVNCLPVNNKGTDCCLVNNLPNDNIMKREKFTYKELYEYLTDNPGVYTNVGLCDMSGLSTYTVRKLLKDLEYAGLVKRSGEGKGSKWIVTTSKS